MADFGELLTQYAERAGIRDSELARRIGVSRLTLVRWKEGVTARPRYREDVERCAEALRLSDEERALLLTAAGFAAPADSTATVAGDTATEGRSRQLPRRALLAAAAAFLALTAAVALVAGLRSPAGGPQPVVVGITPTATAAATAAATVPAPSTATAAPLPDPTATATVAPAPPAGGGPLIVVAPFTSFTPGEGYNVHGRLREVIEAEMLAANLTGARAQAWAHSVANEEEAQGVLASSGASVVIWGEYDSGHVIARFTTAPGGSSLDGQQVIRIASTPGDLPVVVNFELTSEVRHAALVTLGELYIGQGEFDLAKPVLIQASVRPPADPYARASLHSLMGRAYMGGELADLDEAVWLFTRSIAVQPSAEAHANRGLAYLERGREGDAARAIADLTLALGIDSESATAYLGRAAAYIARGAPGDGALATADLDAAASFDPSLTPEVERLRAEASLS